MGFVYFIQAQPSGNIKIGYSEHPNSRLRQLQTATHERLAFVGMFEGDQENERLLHQLFSEIHISGEWYEPHGGLIHYLNRRSRPLCEGVEDSVSFTIEGVAGLICLSEARLPDLDKKLSELEADISEIQSQKYALMLVRQRLAKLCQKDGESLTLHEAQEKESARDCMAGLRRRKAAEAVLLRHEAAADFAHADALEAETEDLLRRGELVETAA